MGGEQQHKQHHEKKENPNVVMGGTGTEQPRDAQTGEPVRPVDARQVHVTQAEFESWKEEEAQFWESKGNYEKAHKLRGKIFNPTIGVRVKQFGAKAKDALVTVAIVAVPGGIIIWLGNQFLRFVSPKLRERLPAWGVNYMGDETTTTRRR